jgi:hypothetical protein
MALCTIPACACYGTPLSCDRCHGAGWHYEADPSGATEEHMGVSIPRLLEKYCGCPRGLKRQQDGT